jgi:transcription initiation factor IIF auxiliary subunit
MDKTMRPHLGARFLTSASGEPEFVGERDHRHYKVILEIEDLPKDVYAATFELHPTYYDPVRTLRPDQNGQIRLETTTYGDYDLSVLLRTKEGEERIRGNLLQELRRWYEKMGLSNPAIQKALADIAAN